MDGVGAHRPDRDAPLAMPAQDFERPFRDPAAPPLPPSGAGPWRLAVFAPTAAATLVLALAFADWFRPGGVGWVEPVMIALVCLSFFWIALSVSTAAAGLAAMARPAASAAGAPRAMTVALVVPIHNESVTDVFGNAAAMLGDLARQDLARPGGRHDFTLWILSDTRDPAIAAAEACGLAALRRRVPGARIRYRRRAANIDRKAGNIADWLRSHGSGHAAMLVLDADSLMSGAAIVALTDALAADPAAGLVQTVPQIHAACTLFGRMQACAGAVYGPVLAAGLARWAGDAGNYWGHNAIMRTGAFAAACGLPHLAGGRLILSHDFVEAALLRRAGWAVRMRPDIGGSLEEAPQTLVDFV
ncbi:MAG: glucans biosynthesis glucosyltransferase MdoH, partial [Gemmobacter sp.]